jgi:hypothetical protein
MGNYPSWPESLSGWRMANLRHGDAEGVTGSSQIPAKECPPSRQPRSRKSSIGTSALTTLAFTRPSRPLAARAAEDCNPGVVRFLDGRLADSQQFGEQLGTNVIAENVWQVGLEVSQTRSTHLVLYGGAFLLIASRY